MVCAADDLAEMDGSRGYGVALVAAGDTFDENLMTAGNYSELEWLVCDTDPSRE